MREYRLFINGDFVESSTKSTFDSINPFNREIVARCQQANVEDAKKAIAAARIAFDNGPWTKMTREERGALIKAVSDKINERKTDLEMLEVDDSGSTIRKAKEDIFLSARAMNYFSKLALIEPTEQIEGLSKPGFSKNMILREPVGVVAAIIPWNFPLKMAVWKLGPALAAGNTIVLKPSELTPATAMELASMFKEAGFPPGVVNIITGYGQDVGEELVRNPMVDKVTFTGSTAVGKRVMSLASETLKKCTLECGGKSANIMLEDADMNMAVDGALYAIFYHQGQCCEAGTRLLLDEKIHDEFVQRLLQKTATMKIGNPKDITTDIGPVISEAQQKRILAYIKSGIDQGAKPVIGGKVPDKPECRNGFFIEPTIFTGVINSMTIAQEEIFGPVLSVIKYGTVEEAITIANNSIYGLGAGVWSRDIEKALSIAKRLRSGTVWINEWHLISEKAPFGGYKQSGVGREFGLEGLHEYMETKHLHIDEVGSRDKKPWYNTVVPQKSEHS
ncbi:MAG: aldehyde dehydrogenase family protein [Bacteroidota bacterium]